jgi:hypothetical protein
MAVDIQCGKCYAVIPPVYFNLDHLTPCPKCSSDMQVLVFPALFRRAAQVGPVMADASDATCFYHAENRVKAPCASCGRFLCALCETEIGGEVLCPRCIHAGVTSRKMTRLENRRVLYDNVALAVATGPMLLVWPTLFTAPMSIFLAIRYWKAPLSIVKRTRIRFVLAIVFAFSQLAAWGFIAYAMLLVRGSNGIK